MPLLLTFLLNDYIIYTSLVCLHCVQAAPPAGGAGGRRGGRLRRRGGILSTLFLLSTLQEAAAIEHRSVSCLHCFCCLLYKKRQPSNTGPWLSLYSQAEVKTFCHQTLVRCLLVCLIWTTDRQNCLLLVHTFKWELPWKVQQSAKASFNFQQHAFTVNYMCAQLPTKHSSVPRTERTTCNLCIHPMQARKGQPCQKETQPKMSLPTSVSSLRLNLS